MAVRAAPLFAATVTDTDPGPVPLAGHAVAQVALLAAVQPQAVPLAETATVPVAPVPEADKVVWEIPYVQESADWLIV